MFRLPIIAPARATGRSETRRRRVNDDEKAIEATKAPLIEHLIELRSRLIKALIAFAVMFVVCFFFAKQIYNVLVWPFVWLDRHVAVVRRHGYLLATVAVKPR